MLLEVMMAKIQIDGAYYTVQTGKNILETCLALGIYVPHFCYHPAMGSVGACRLCAVKKFKNSSDARGIIVMSCMEPVADGLILEVGDPEAKAFREAVIEGLMINHPHDCPVCDEGGECHLQDMTVMTGHNYRRFGFKKRTYVNQHLGPFIHHEMNRCIQCYRCVRFYNDYAGGGDLGVFGAHDHLYFGRHESGTLESEFSGNLVEVCPTGVFTDKTLKNHFTRKWDLTNAPSLCTHCSLGCNIIAGERHGELRRIMNRYNGSVNGYFLCDRGRFGYEFVNGPKRIKKATIRISRDKDPMETSPDILNGTLSSAFSGNKKTIGIGSPRASLEANFALSRLVGRGNFYHGISRREHALVNTAIEILRRGTARSPSLKEIEKADAVFILGEDLTNTAPLAALAVRQAARNKGIKKAVNGGIPQWHDYAVRQLAQDMKSPLFIATPFGTKLDELAENTYRAPADDIARLGFAVAASVHENAPSATNLDEKQQLLAQRIAEALKSAASPLIITGCHSGSLELLLAAANISEALALTGKKALLSFILPECNSMGLGMMDGGALDDALEQFMRGEADQVIILENDLYRRADKHLLDMAFGKCSMITVLDHSENDTTRLADILLPVGTFAESEGTLVNNEGRAQRYYNVLPPGVTSIESWRQIRDIMRACGNQEATAWENFDGVVQTMAESIPAFSKIKEHLPHADFRILNEKIRRQTIRYSGRTALLANIAVSEPKPPDDPDSPLAFTMEGSDENPPSGLVSYYWTPGWNSYQAMNFYIDEPNGSLKGGDPGIRLIEPDGTGTLSFYKPQSLPFSPVKGEWLVVPVYQIFGSGELSSASRSLAARIPHPFVCLNSRDMESTGVQQDERVEFTLVGKSIQVTVRCDNTLPDGIAGMSAGFPGMPCIELPGWGRLTKITL
jgi:NADH-quinone oxidoreductase subunit G